MKPTIIKIDRKTVRNNPNAGQTSYRLPAGYELQGEYIGDLPKWLEEKAIIKSSTFNGHSQIHEFSWNDEITPDLIAKLSNDKSVKFTLESNYVTCESYTPEPSHFYEYMNTPVQCTTCNSKVGYKEIKTAYYHDADGDEHNADECPVCGSINSFDYEFETL